MKIAFYGDSLTEGIPGAAYFRILEGKFPGGVRLDSAGAEIVAETFLKMVRSLS